MGGRRMDEGRRRASGGGSWALKSASGDRKHIAGSFPETGTAPGREGWTAGRRSCNVDFNPEGGGWRGKSSEWGEAAYRCSIGTHAVERSATTSDLTGCPLIVWSAEWDQGYRRQECRRPQGRIGHRAVAVRVNFGRSRSLHGPQFGVTGNIHGGGLAAGSHSLPGRSRMHSLIGGRNAAAPRHFPAFLHS